MRKLHSKPMIAVLMTITLLASSAAEAQRLGASRSSSSSASRSTSPPAVSKPSRAGNGTSMGMTRSNTMNAVRSQPQPAPTPSYAQPGRAAPTVTPNAGYRQAQAAPAPAPAPAKRNSWMAPAAAGVAAGALAGYALANTGNSTPPAAPAPQYQQPVPQHQQVAPVYADQAPGYAQAAPAQAPVYPQTAPAVAVAPSYAQAPAAVPQSSGGFGFGSFLVLLLLIGAGVFLYRRYAGNKADFNSDARRTGNAARASIDAFKTSLASEPAASAKPQKLAVANPVVSTDVLQDDVTRVSDDLRAIAHQYYYDLQSLNNDGNVDELRKRVGDDGLFNELYDAIRMRSAPTQTVVVSITPEVVDLVDEGNRFVGSVRYQGLVKESPSHTADVVDEVFHFVKDKGVQGSWKLAGIEQVGMA